MSSDPEDNRAARSILPASMTFLFLFFIFTLLSLFLLHFIFVSQAHLAMPLRQILSVTPSL